MRVLVTGGAGFIGSHLTEELLHKNYDVHVLDSMVSGRKENIPSLAVLHEADICSKEAKEIIQAIRPEAVFHLAAQADVTKSIQSPSYDADVNVTGTLNILEACLEAKVKQFIFASTSAVYGSFQKELIKETDPADPISYYGLSKLTAERYIRLFSGLHGLSCTILRYGNVYGPRQKPKGEGGVVAVFLENIQKGLPLRVHGDGEQSRDFIYVKDVAKANIAAFENKQQGTYHVSTGKRTSINQLLKLMEEVHRTPLSITHTDARLGDIKHSCLSNEEARQHLKWTPESTVAAGIHETYQYECRID